MKKENLEIVKLAAGEILLQFCDLTAPFFLGSSIYRKSTREYLNNREIDKANFWQKIQYLKRKGYIRTFTENKEKFIEITSIGQKKALKISIDQIKIERPSSWDKKWRVVIFDIPEKYKTSRDLFRRYLIKLGFIQIQKSVYTYPFGCAKEIAILSQKLLVEKYVTILIAEIIQGEDEIIETFIDSRILDIKDIK